MGTALAAHDVLVVLSPGSAASANSLLTETLAQIEESEFKARGIQIGKDAAQAVLAARQSDPPVWPANSAYAPDMGSFRPNPHAK